MVTDRGPLTEKKVLVTRPVDQSEKMVALIEENGGIPLLCPVIKIVGTDRYPNFNLDRFQWLVFTSVNAVNHFFKSIHEYEFKVTNQRVAAVGEKTEMALKRHGVVSVLVPETYDAEALVPLLKANVIKGDKILFPKGNLAPSFIKDQLCNYCEVTEWIVYETKPRDDLDLELTKEADCIFFLSSSAITFLTEHFKKEVDHQIFSLPVFCIGKSTHKTAIESGFQHVYMSEKATTESMIDRAIHYFGGGV